MLITVTSQDIIRGRLRFDDHGNPVALALNRAAGGLWTVFCVNGQWRASLTGRLGLPEELRAFPAWIVLPGEAAVWLTARAERQRVRPFAFNLVLEPTPAEEVTR